MVLSSWQAIARVHPVHLMNAGYTGCGRQVAKPANLDCESTGSQPLSNTWFLGLAWVNPPPQTASDRFCRFCTAYPCDQHRQTDTRTMLRVTWVAIGRICALHAGDAALRTVTVKCCRVLLSSGSVDRQLTWSTKKWWVSLIWVKVTCAEDTSSVLAVSVFLSGEMDTAAAGCSFSIIIIQGTRLRQSPGFLFVKFPGPGVESPVKWVWSRKVLEFSRLWCKCRCQNLRKFASILSVYTKKIAGGRGSALDPIVTAVCLYNYCSLFASRCAYKIDKLISIMRWQQGTTKATVSNEQQLE